MDRLSFNPRFKQILGLGVVIDLLIKSSAQVFKAESKVMPNRTFIQLTLQLDITSCSASLSTYIKNARVCREWLSEWTIETRLDQ